MGSGTLVSWLPEPSSGIDALACIEPVLAPSFPAVIPQMAGCNTVDTGALTDFSLFITIIPVTERGLPGALEVA